MDAGSSRVVMHSGQLCRFSPPEFDPLDRHATHALSRAMWRPIWGDQFSNLQMHSSEDKSSWNVHVRGICLVLFSSPLSFRRSRVGV
jgi:hypothetical protein